MAEAVNVYLYGSITTNFYYYFQPYRFE